MNQHSRRLFLSALACAAIILAPALVAAAGKPSAAAATQNQAAGRLVIKRSAHLGSSLVNLSIDGKQVAKIGFNGNYEGPLAAGSHVITVFPIAGREHPQPYTTRITVEPGKTYTFTLVRSDVSVILK